MSGPFGLLEVTQGEVELAAHIAGHDLVVLARFEYDPLGAPTVRARGYAVVDIYAFLVIDISKHFLDVAAVPRVALAQNSHVRLPLAPHVVGQVAN